MTRTTPIQGAAVSLLIVGCWLAPGDAWSGPPAARGTIAVVNVGRGGAEVVQRTSRELARYSGGRARRRAVADALAGRPARAQAGANALQLAEALRRARRSAGTEELFALGRLLGVDYLLLLKVGPKKLSARLFSVHRQRFAPQGFERADHQTDQLLLYVRAQARVGVQPKRRATRQARPRRWWVWAAAAAAAATVVAISVAAGGDDREGDLTIRVIRR